MPGMGHICEMIDFVLSLHTLVPAPGEMCIHRLERLEQTVALRQREHVPEVGVRGEMDLPHQGPGKIGRAPRLATPPAGCEFRVRRTFAPQGARSGSAEPGARLGD